MGGGKGRWEVGRSLPAAARAAGGRPCGREAARSLAARARPWDGVGLRAPVRGRPASGEAVVSFRSWMDAALVEARAAGARGETPVGAVVVDPARGEVVAAAGNRVRELRDPTAHAEMLALRAACAARGSERPGTLDLWVTLEPCAMCAGALAGARISRIYYGAPDPKSGGTDHGARVFDHPQAHHRPEVYGGIAEAECAALLRAFFAGLRG